MTTPHSDALAARHLASSANAGLGIIKQQGLDLEHRRNACRAMADDALEGVIAKLGSRTLRKKSHRLLLQAAKEEIEHRKGMRR